MSADSSVSSKPIPTQQLFFQVILLNMKNKPDVDWVVVAEKAGYISGSTARVRFNQIMNKLSAEGGRNPLKTTSSKALEGIAMSHTSAGKNPLASRITKSKPVQRRNKKNNVKRNSVHWDSGVEDEKMPKGLQESE